MNADGFTQRLNESFAKSGIKTKAELATALDISPQYLNKLMKGSAQNQPPADLVKRIADILQVRLEWLITGEGLQDLDPRLKPVDIFDDADPRDCQDDDQIVFIKQIDVNFGCGHGVPPTYEEQNTIKPRAYRLSWFQENRRKPENCVCCRVVGDSMEPTLYDGDCVLIDTSDIYRIANGHVYAFYIDDEIRIKRLYRSIKGDLTIVSDNPDYEKEVLAHDEETVVMGLIGRVIEKSGTSNL